MKPSIPKGTRDFTPEVMVRRKYIFNHIEEVFRLFGYQAIETPAMENLSTLLGKYGDEGDKLLFRILNSGNYLSGLENDTLTSDDSNGLTAKISEKGLRYDLTVPFARYVVQHQNEISFPFKRYQIQPVWRADRPQKGRYREFYQCDADIIGSNSLLNEVELIEIIDRVFQGLNLPVLIKLNNRKILAGIADYMGVPGNFQDITTVLDKLERIGPEKVNEELADKGIPQESITKLEPVLNLQGDTPAKLKKLALMLEGSVIGMEGIREVSEIFENLSCIDLRSALDLDLSLARGLNYYTGAIIEVKAIGVNIGSVCGGGRYDDLTGIFGLENVSGVGISFGADRIFDVLSQLDLFPAEVNRGTELLFVNFGRKEEKFILSLLRNIRDAGIVAEIYPEAVKLKKQMTYAQKNRISFVALVGESELEDGLVTLKNMDSGEQKKVRVDELIKILKNE